MVHGACDLNKWDSIYANRTVQNTSIVRAARQLYMKDHPEVTFESLKDYEDIMPTYISMLAKDYQTRLIQQVFNGKVDLSIQNVDAVLSENYSFKEINTLTEGLTDIFYYTFNILTTKNADGKYPRDYFNNLVEDYKASHNGLEPSEEYLFRHMDFSEISREMRNFAIEALTAMEDNPDLMTKDNANLLKRALGDISRTTGTFQWALLLWKIKDVFYNNCGIKFGKKSSIVLTAEDIDDSDPVGAVILEESIKEGYLRETDKENPLKKVTSGANLYLSRLIQTVYVENADGMMEAAPVVGQFGFEKRINVSKVTTDLLNILVGCNSIEEMKERFTNVLSTDPVITQIYNDVFTSDKQEILQREFFKSFCGKMEANMNSIINATISEKENDSIIAKPISYIKRWGGRSAGVNSYIYNIQKAEMPEFSIFKHIEDSNRNVMNGDAWLDLVDDVNLYIVADPSTHTAMFSLAQEGLDTISAEELKIGLLKRWFAALNISIPDKVYSNIISNSEAENTILDNLYSLISTEVAVNEDNSVKNFLSAHNEANLKNLKGIFRGIELAQDAKVRMVRVNDSNYSTFVMSNKLGKDINKILHFKRLADLIKSSRDVTIIEKSLDELATNLREYIDKTYINGSKEFAVRDKDDKLIILNDILNQLYHTTGKDFLNPDSFINNFRMIRTMTLEREGRITDADEFSPSQNIEVFLKNFLFTAKNTNNKYTAIPCFTSGDTQTVRSLVTSLYTNMDAIANRLVNVAMSEVQRMELQARAVKKFTKDMTKSISADADLSENDPLTGNFSILYFLNDYKDDLRLALNNKQFTPVVKAILLGKTVEYTYKNKEDEEVVFSKDYSREYQADKTLDNIPIDDAYFQTLREDEKRVYTGGVLFREFMNTFWKDAKNAYVFSNINKRGTFKAFPNILASSVTLNSSDNQIYMFYLNSLLGYCSQFGLTGYNPTYAATGENYSKQLVAQAVALQKRNKANYTPGSFMNVDAKFNGKYFARTNSDGTVDPSERCIYFTEAARNLKVENKPLYEYIVKVAGQEAADRYLNIKSTDGQGFRILPSYRRVRGMASTWNTNDLDEHIYLEIDKIRKQAYERAEKLVTKEEIKSIVDNDKLSYEKAKKIAIMRKAKFSAKDIDTLNEFATTFQPFKPHLCGTERVEVSEGQFLNVPVEHKYAEVLLIPEIFEEGSFYKELAIQMEVNDIDVAMSEECVKVGMFNKVDLFNQHSTDETTGKKIYNMNQAFNSALDSKKSLLHTMNYADYALQIEVPLHSHEAQLQGTQERKQMLDALLSDDNPYNLTSPLSGTISHFHIGSKEYNLNRTQGRKDALKLYNGLIAAGFVNNAKELKSILNNPKRLSDVLTTLKSNDRDAGYQASSQYALTERNGKSAFKYDLKDPLTRYDTEGTLMGLFKKRILKQHILGGSAVQMSDAGFDLQIHLEEINGEECMTYSDCATVWNYSYTDKSGKEIPLKYSDYVDDNGDLIKLEDGRIKLDVEFPGIRDMVAYRIPTERDYSIVNLKATKFLPKIMGGVIATPYAFVTAAGWDFDIDKLYYFLREYVEKSRQSLSKPEIANIWAKIYGIKISKNKKGQVIIDETNATDIYKKLKAFKVKALKLIELQSKNETSEESLPITTQQLSNIAKMDEKVEKYLKNLQELNQQQEEINKENNKEESKKEIETLQEQVGEVTETLEDLLYDGYLYELWNYAGLSEQYGSAEEYFDQYIIKEDPSDRWLRASGNFNPYTLDRVSRNNLLIDFIQSRLTDPKTANARTVPGGFKPASDASKVIKDVYAHGVTSLQQFENLIKNPVGEDIFYAPINPWSTAIYNARNIIAKQIIGIMANHNTNMIFSQALHSMSLTTPINMFGNSYSDLLGKERIYSTKNKGQSIENQGVRYLAMLLAASVDAVKDPVLNFLNINKSTANVAALMSRLGMSPLQVGLFLNQPAIKQVCETLENTGGSNIENAIKKIGKLYTKGNVYTPAVCTTNFTEYDLARTIGSHGDTIGGANQIEVLNMFYQLNKQAEALSKFISKTKFTAANSIDNTLGSMISIFLNTEQGSQQEIEDNLHVEYDSDTAEIVGKSEIIMKGLDINSPEYAEKLATTPLAIEQAMHDLFKYFIGNVDSYFNCLGEVYQDLYTSVLKDNYKQNISTEAVNAIHYSYPLYVLQHTDLDGYVNVMNPQSPSFYNTSLTNRDYYTKLFPKQLREVLTERQRLKSILDEYSTGQIEDIDGEDVYNYIEDTYESLQDKYIWLENVSIDTFLYMDNVFLDSLEVSEYDSKVTEDEMEEYHSDSNKVSEEAELQKKEFAIKLADNVQFDKDASRNLTADWDSLLSEDGAHYNFATNLLLYSIHKVGFKASTLGFGMLASPRLRNSCPVLLNNDRIITYNDFMPLIGTNAFGAYNSNQNRKDFIKLLYANNATNGSMVKQYYGNIDSKDTRSTFEWPIFTKTGNTIKFTFTNNKGAISLLIPSETKGEFKVLPCFTINNGTDHSFYVLSTDNVTLKKGQEASVTYIEIPIRNGSDFSSIDTAKEKLFDARIELKDNDIFTQSSVEYSTEPSEADKAKIEEEKRAKQKQNNSCNL